MCNKYLPGCSSLKAYSHGDDANLNHSLLNGHGEPYLFSVVNIWNKTKISSNIYAVQWDMFVYNIIHSKKKVLYFTARIKMICMKTFIRKCKLFWNPHQTYKCEFDKAIYQKLSITHSKHTIPQNYIENTQIIRATYSTIT